MTMINRASAKLSADVKIVAQKSQAAPLALLGLCALSLIGGFFFLWHQPERSWICFLFSFLFLAVGTICWWLSHKRSDLDSGAPTIIDSKKTGLSLTTDSRLLDSKSSAETLARLITEIAHREPLPEPDGMIDENGIPNPERKAEAKKIVDEANEEAHKAALSLQNTPSETRTISSAAASTHTSTLGKPHS
ncbi:hypothetical protein ACMG4M_15405 [Alcanivorax sp. IL3]|uniref:hypothetical protein n=1 Tax=unclassified Alcanivorax TaxID=2638842 RepID=UPI0039C40FB2